MMAIRRLPWRAMLAIGLVAGPWVDGAWGQGAEPPPVHYRWGTPGIAPGVIGQDQLMRGVAEPDTYQPVRVVGPQGLTVSVQGSDQVMAAPADFALAVGAVYRLRLDGLPEQPGVSLYPSVELIDRMHPPPGAEGRFPIVLAFSREDLDDAVSGRMVTKVIYLEQPDLALPLSPEPDELSTFNAPAGENPLQAADALGRPVAILRIGRWAPLQNSDPLAGGPGAETPSTGFASVRNPAPMQETFTGAAPLPPVPAPMIDIPQQELEPWAAAPVAAPRRTVVTFGRSNPGVSSKTATVQTPQRSAQTTLAAPIAPERIEYESVVAPPKAPTRGLVIYPNRESDARPANQPNAARTPSASDVQVSPTRQSPPVIGDSSSAAGWRVRRRTGSAK